MLKLNKVHHIAIIVSNYELSKIFYTDILGLKVVAETYREQRDSYKLDLALGDDYIIELFSFPSSPARISEPEAVGLRHLAFEVDDIEGAVKDLQMRGVEVEDIRTDEITEKRFVFFSDPDGLPIELYEKK